MMDYQKAKDRKGFGKGRLERAGYALGGPIMGGPMAGAPMASPSPAMMPNPGMAQRPMVKRGGKTKK